MPRILVVMGAYRNLDGLERTLARLDHSVLSLIEEIAVFDVFSEEDAVLSLAQLKGNPAWEKLRYFRIPRPYDYGENLKNAFDYAIEREFDYVAVLRGDGYHDPSDLGAFLAAAVSGGRPVVIGDRSRSLGWAALVRSASIRLLANRLLSTLEDLVLGMGVKDYHCGFRLISTDVLKRVPYGLNRADYLFDLQLLIQIRCLGVPICAVPVPEFSDRSMSIGTMARYAARALMMAVEYRLHQLHLVRRSEYLVDLGEHYTLKRNRYSSHMQILDSLKPGSKVLDVGCGQSLLAEEYARRSITVVGIDGIEPEKVSRFVSHYIRHDLETPLDLPYGREFDYVILSDVIEHLRNRDALMASLRRHLKEDGKLIASTGNIAIWFYRLSLLAGRFEYGPRGILDRTHVHLFTLDSFRRFFQQEGYRLLEENYTPIPFELVFSSTGRSGLVEAITRWYYYLSVAWPSMFAYQFIICCTFRSYESAMGEQGWEPRPVTDSDESP